MTEPEQMGALLIGSQFVLSVIAFVWAVCNWITGTPASGRRRRR